MCSIPCSSNERLEFVTTTQFAKLTKEVENLQARNSAGLNQTRLSPGLFFFSSCLIAITMVCAIGIILSGLALGGILPQFITLFGMSNVIWITVSSGIVALMSTVFAISLAVFHAKTAPKQYTPSPEILQHPLSLLESP